MKNIYLILLSLLIVCLSNTLSYGQNIDSIYTIPEKLVIDEETSLVIQVTLPHSAVGTISKSHNWKEDTLFIEVCYVNGPLTSMQTHTDTFVLGKMNFNKFVVQVTANISKKYDTCLVFKSQSKVQHLPPLPLSNKNIFNGSDLQLYPNPCKNELLVLGRNFNQINIIDYQGIVVHQIMVDDRNEKRINIETLAKGLYIIECLQKGVTVYRQKIIKN